MRHQGNEPANFDPAPQVTCRQSLPSCFFVSCHLLNTVEAVILYILSETYSKFLKRNELFFRAAYWLVNPAAIILEDGNKVCSAVLRLDWIPNFALTVVGLWKTVPRSLVGETGPFGQENPETDVNVFKVLVQNMIYNGALYFSAFHITYEHYILKLVYIVKQHLAVIWELGLFAMFVDKIPLKFVCLQNEKMGAYLVFINCFQFLFLVFKINNKNVILFLFCFLF